MSANNIDASQLADCALNTSPYSHTKEDDVRDIKEGEVSDIKEGEVSDIKEDEVSDIKEDEVSNIKEGEVSDIKVGEVSDIKEGEVSNQTNDNETLSQSVEGSGSNSEFQNISVFKLEPNHDECESASNCESKRGQKRKRRYLDGSGSQSDSEVTEESTFPKLRVQCNEFSGSMSDGELLEESMHRSKRICRRNQVDKTLKSAYPDVNHPCSEFFDEGAYEHDVCWIKKASVYREHQKYKIRLKHDAAKLFRSMNDNIINLTHADIACYRRWWLNTATEYNYIELVNLMIASKTFDLNIKTNCKLICPLYIAIEQGDLALVQTFLSAGASVTNNPLANAQYFCPSHYIGHKLVNNISCLEFLSEYVSAVEFACIANQPEVLKLLMTHFNSKHPPRTHATLSSDCDFSRLMYRQNKKSEPEERLTHPLHCIVRLATKFCGEKLARLPAFVQLIIDAGGNVDYIDERGYTPLQLLIQKIRRVDALGEEATEYRRIIHDIAKVLLTAGASANMGSFESAARDPLRLLEVHINYFCLMDMLQSKSAYVHFLCVLRDNLKFINDLARLLLRNGADLKRVKLCELILRIPTRMFKNRAFNEYNEYCMGMHDEIMDSLGDLFRLTLLAGSNSLTNDYWSEVLEKSMSIELIIGIACYSSLPGRSQKLIKMLLTAFSANNINKLMAKLSTKRDVAPTSPTFFRHSREEVDRVIKYVEKIDPPRNLEFLACRAINRAVSTRCLCDASVELGLGLPRILESIIYLSDSDS